MTEEDAFTTMGILHPPLHSSQIYGTGKLNSRVPLSKFLNN